MDSRDYINDQGMAEIEELLARMPRSIELGKANGHEKSVTATIKVNGVVGPIAQIDALYDLLNAAMLVETLYLNLVAARRSVAAFVEAGT